MNKEFQVKDRVSVYGACLSTHGSVPFLGAMKATVSALREKGLLEVEDDKCFVVRKDIMRQGSGMQYLRPSGEKPSIWLYSHS